MTAQGGACLTRVEKPFSIASRCMLQFGRCALLLQVIDTSQYAHTRPWFAEDLKGAVSETKGEADALSQAMEKTDEHINAGTVGIKEHQERPCCCCCGGGGG